MISDYSLIDIVSRFLNENKESTQIDNVYTFIPKPTTTVPYGVVFVTDTSEERTEVDRGHDKTVNITTQVLTEKLSDGVENEAVNQKQLYDSSHEVSRLFNSPEFLEYVNDELVKLDIGAGTPRIGDTSKTYGTISSGDRELFTCSIVTPLIFFEQVETIT